MILLVILLIVISFIEIKKYIKKTQKKEMAVFFISVVLAFAMGVYYLYDPCKSSFTEMLLDMLKIPH